MSSYKMSSILVAESLVDETIAAFYKRIDEEFVHGSKADTISAMDQWLYYFAWDVVGQMSLSKPMGFIEAGADHSDMIKTGEKAMDHFAVVGQMPFLDELLAKNPVYPIGPPSFEAAAGFCFMQTVERQQDAKSGISKGKDMLDSYF